MGRIRILNTVFSDYEFFIRGVLNDYDRIATAADRVVFIDDDTGRRLVLAGNGFTFSGGTATGGTVTSVTLRENGIAYAVLDRFSDALTAVMTDALAADYMSFTVRLGPTWFLGNIGVDVCVTGSGNDTIRGGASTDEAWGQGGNDTILGQDGDDTLLGGQGADFISGGLGFDYTSYRDATAGLTVSLADPFLNTGIAAGDRFDRIEAIEGTNFADNLTGDGIQNAIYARAGNDTLNGLAGDDFLTGMDGDDRIDGGDDNDTLLGGQGADSISGGSGFDYTSYSDASAGVRVSLANPAINTGFAAGDQFDQIEGIEGSDFNDTLTGSGIVNSIYARAGNDVLNGLAGGDFLYGMDGDDRIAGGNGFDTLTGGFGRDRFVFNGTTEGSDFVADFEAADLIQIRVANFDPRIGISAAHGFADPTVNFVIGNTPVAGEGTFLYDTITGLLSFDADGTGAGLSMAIATLAGAPTLDASQFYLV